MCIMLAHETTLGMTECRLEASYPQLILLYYGIKLFIKLAFG